MAFLPALSPNGARYTAFLFSFAATSVGVDLDRTLLTAVLLPSYRRRITVFDAYQRLSTVFKAYHLMTHHLTTYDLMSYSLFLLPVFSLYI